MPILTVKHFREAPSPEDGTRILVMRYWPRGVRKERFDAWYRHLAPSADLLRAFKDLRETAPESYAEGPGDADWDRLMARYHAEMRIQQENFLELRERHTAGEVITLLCGCHDPGHCHRTHLAGMILEPEGYWLGAMTGGSASS
jgi:uncharacterized protein YeaO (DUF488 family)